MTFCPFELHLIIEKTIDNPERNLMTMTAEQTTRIEKMETELHEQRQIFIQGKGRGLTLRSVVPCLVPLFW